MLDMELVSPTVLTMTIVGMGREISQVRSLSDQKRRLFTLFLNQAVVLLVMGLVLAKFWTASPDISAGLQAS